MREVLGQRLTGALTSATPPTAEGRGRPVDLLGHAGALAVVGEVVRAAGARLGVLPVGRPPLVVVDQLAARRRPRAGRCAALHVARRVIARGVARAGSRRGMQVGGIAICVAAERPTRQPVQRVVGEALRLGGRRQRRFLQGYF